MLNRILLFALAVPSLALASITYSYTGNAFTNCQVGDCSALTHVSASLVVAAPLAPSTTYSLNSGQPGVALSLLNWTMFNGLDSVSPLISDPDGSHQSFIFLMTDAFGQIETWVVQGVNPTYSGPTAGLSMSTGNSLSLYDSDATSRGESGVHWDYIAFIDHNPGRWSVAATVDNVPEPASIGLTSLAGLALLAMRRRSVQSRATATLRSRRER
jgi:hypothetical protein